MITQHNSGSPDIAIHGSIAAAPVVAFITNYSPILTAIAALFSIGWFAVLFYDRFISKKEDK